MLQVVNPEVEVVEDAEAKKRRLDLVDRKRAEAVVAAADAAIAAAGAMRQAIEDGDARTAERYANALGKAAGAAGVAKVAALVETATPDVVMPGADLLALVSRESPVAAAIVAGWGGTAPVAELPQPEVEATEAELLDEVDVEVEGVARSKRKPNASISRPTDPTRLLG